MLARLCAHLDCMGAAARATPNIQLQTGRRPPGCSPPGILKCACLDKSARNRPEYCVFV
ncbi:hypothetical protein PUN4_660076 [Paraburkholderia unamae]|nr:hypothetical protein PUN4_660076 [Paraburkholderia unamae]